MSEQFLATEELLHALTQELQRYQSASQQLSIAGDNTAAILEISGRIVALGGQLAEQGKRQLSAIDDLLEQAQMQVSQVMQRQQAAATATEHKLNELNAKLTALQAAHSQSVEVQARTGKLLEAIQVSLHANDKYVNGVAKIVTAMDKRTTDVAAALDLQGQRLVVLRNDFGMAANQIAQLLDASASGVKKTSELAATQATQGQQLAHITAKADQQEVALSALHTNLAATSKQVLTIERTLTDAVRPHLQTLQQEGRLLRSLLVISLLLGVSNAVLVGYLVYLAMR